MVDKSKLEFGSPAWRTHMRRSLAQRKRYGEKITDVEGLIDYIEKKGPAKGGSDGTKASRVKTITKRNGNTVHSKKRASKTRTNTSRSGKKYKEVPSRNSPPQKPQELIPDSAGLYEAPAILKVR